jgi:predicted  nucleic acid-binding Zn-ribbon protein
VQNVTRLLLTSELNFTSQEKDELGTVIIIDDDGNYKWNLEYIEDGNEIVENDDVWEEIDES